MTIEEMNAKGMAIAGEEVSTPAEEIMLFHASMWKIAACICERLERIAEAMEKGTSDAHTPEG
jgi:hypothetical protein